MRGLQDADLANSPDAAELLCEYMSEISEDYWCAGWLHGLEFSLWKMLRGGSRDFGTGDVKEEELSKLRQLSQRAGGWVIWDEQKDASMSGNRFVPLALWTVMYDGEKSSW